MKKLDPEKVAGFRFERGPVGCLLTHGFTGSPPFEGKNAEEVLNKHMKQSLIPLRKKNPKVSSALGRVIEKMMAKKSENRYQDYKGIIKDLKGLESRVQKFQRLKNATLIFRMKPRESVTS